MPKTPEARLNAIERTLIGPPGTPRAYSHAQLVRIAAARVAGESDPDVGAPAAILEPGQRSHAELIAEVGRQATGGPPVLPGG